MLIRNCRTFIDGEVKERELLLEDGKIKKIGNSIRGEDEVFDAHGLVLIPGLIDPHVHFREPGDTYKEDFRSGGQAAIAGGFTSVIDMPNNKFPTITADRLREKKELSKKALCSVYFHFGATESNFEEVKKAKPESLKIYMGRSTGDLLVSSEEALKKHFQLFDHEKPIVLHAEDHEYMERTGKRDSGASIRAVEKAVRIAGEVGRRIHIAHATTDSEIKLVKKFRKGTAEVTPHHLFLSQKDEGRLGKLCGVNPPLRNEQEKRGLWEVLGQVDCIATDHAPHTLEDKENGAKGFPGLETSAGLMFDAYNKGLIEFEELVEKMSSNPARIFGLKRVGRIKNGYSADLILIDLRKEWIVKGEEQFTKCKWSPFEGKKLKGKVVAVVKGGKLVYQEGEFVS